MKKVAVITPVYNAEKFVADCINSVAKSITFDKFELEHVLVDDASTDNSWKIIQKFKLPLLKKFRLSKNGGPSAARNYAIKKTDADYIFCLDADDVIFQNSLFRLFQAAEENKWDWIYGDFAHVDSKLRYLSGQDYYGWNFKSPKKAISSIFGGRHFFQQNCFFSKEIFKQAGEYDEKLTDAEDLDLFIRFLFADHHPNYLSGQLYLHRLHESNLSAKHQQDSTLHRRNLEILKRKYKL